MSFDDKELIELLEETERPFKEARELLANNIRLLLRKKQLKKFTMTDGTGLTISIAFSELIDRIEQGKITLDFNNLVGLAVVLDTDIGVLFDKNHRFQRDIEHNSSKSCCS